MNFSQFLIVICVTLSCIVFRIDAKNVGRAGGVCKPDSFTLSPILLSDGGTDIINVFNLKADVTISLPPGFDDAADYKNSCLDKRIFKLIKTAAPNKVIESKSLEKSDQSTNFQFANLDYLAEYEVQSFYTQTGPSNIETASGKETIKTCFGEPSKVTNLKVELFQNDKLKITWAAPTTIKADKVCYYEIKIAKDKYPSQSNTYTVSGDVTEYITGTDQDIRVGWRITVTANNDKSYNGLECYANVSTCNKKGSGVVEAVYEPAKTSTPRPTTTTLTTPNGAGTAYQMAGCKFFISFFSIFVYFIRLY